MTTDDMFFASCQVFIDFSNASFGEAKKLSLEGLVNVPPELLTHLDKAKDAAENALTRRDMGIKAASISKIQEHYDAAKALAKNAFYALGPDDLQGAPHLRLLTMDLVPRQTTLSVVGGWPPFWLKP